MLLQTKTFLRSIALAGVLAWTAPGLLHAQENNALLEALVRKGILTDQEAEDIRADLVSEYATSNAGKIDISSDINQLKIGGDTRLRFQYDNTDSQQPDNGNDRQRVRYRFRLRLNAEYDFAGPFFGGFSLETGNDANGANQTFSNGFQDYDIYISKVYLGWNATDWLTVIAGKQDNPFYTTNLVWDSDINPQGMVETVEFNKLFGWGDVGTGGYSKDGKTFLGSTERRWVEPKWSLNLVAGQFIFFDNDESLFDNDQSDDAWLFQTQLVFGYQFSGKAALKIAPGWLVYNAATLGTADSFTDRNIAGNAANPTLNGATRNLSLLLFPGEISFPLFGTSAAFVWDFAYNTSGDSRVDSQYGGAGTLNSQDRIAFLAGIKLGKAKKAGSWGIFGNYRQTGVAALDPNLTDSDFNGGKLNARGFETGIEYALTDYIKVGLEYNYAWNLNDDLVNPVSGGNVNHLFQLDLNWKF